MAQLIKLQDYISRYQLDLTRYPTQYVRLKRTQWEKVKQQWLSGGEPMAWEHFGEEEEQPKRFSILKRWFAKKRSIQDDMENVDGFQHPISDTEEHGDGPDLSFEPKIIHRPSNLEELKRMFLDQLFQFQIRWASSTLLEQSNVDPRFYRDSFLKTVLQRLPDNYFVFYYPVIKVKNAPIELDVILLSPTECLCITLVEAEEDAFYVGDGERFWTKKIGKRDVKILNPLLQLNRMEMIVNQLFKHHQVEIPIRKILLSRNGYFDRSMSHFNVQYVDKRGYSSWLLHLKHSPSPIKKNQFEAAQAILNSVETAAYPRGIRNGQKSEEQPESGS
ncbi:nuclease-related domain-containing protein [Ureibacillus sp. FSL K6-8385]|uniref:nuclease-related domain-containing protein n=1 Tax=Ureibacillus TaxID=160795 RepID=UPI002E1D862D|nr:nuclease-related domain-containing protein [Ureibacillus terrenus]MED3764838.1 nuclease-related domain-containing protein [Ureibacillus terrenus]